MTYNAEGKRTSLENLAGQVTTTAWNCCHKISEIQPDGSTTTWDYDDEGRVTASSRLIPLDITNVTWLTTCYEYDALGRLVSTTADYEPTTEYTYDTLGNRIATTRRVGAAATGTTSILLVDAEWRKTETLSSFVLDNALVWPAKTNIVSCSDAGITPLVTSSPRQITGLTPSLVALSLTTDVRGNVSESRVEFDGFESVVIDINPAQTCRAESHSRLGESVRSVSVSGVESGSFYDGLGRQIAFQFGANSVYEVNMLKRAWFEKCFSEAKFEKCQRLCRGTRKRIRGKVSV